MQDISSCPENALALGISKVTGWERADPAIAFVIAIYIMWNARGIAADVLPRNFCWIARLPEDDRARLRGVVLACPGVSALHDLRTRHAGDRIFVEFHLEVDGELTVSEGHAIGDAAETAVKDLLSGCCGRRRSSCAVRY